MNYRKHKDLTLSEIGFGCYGLSGAYGQKDRKTYKTTLKRAYELGVNFYDTSDAYGDAEAVLGQVVRPFRDQVYIATKVGIKESVQPNLSGEYLQRACEQSLVNLGTEYIDLYQLHFDDPQTPVEDTIRVLERLQDEGKIRHYGLGHLSAARLLAYIQAGEVFSVLMEFSPLTRSAQTDIIPLCQEMDVAAIAFSVTGRGLLSGKIGAQVKFDPGDIRSMDALFQGASFQSGLRIAKKLGQVGARYDKTPAQTAIAWVLTQAGVTCALTGPSTPAHLEENVAGSGWDLTSDDLRELEDFFQSEEQWLEAERYAAIERILVQELNADAKQAFTDLVYGIESAISLGLITEEELLPTFYELFELRDEQGPGSRSKLAEIQSQLKAVLPGE